MPPDNIAILSRLLLSLDEPMSLTLREGSLACMHSMPAKQYGLEMFLCAFYRRYRDALLPYFSDLDAFKALEATLWPDSLESSAASMTEGTTDMAREPNSALGYHVELDLDLTRIILNAARISSALLRAKTSIHDFIASLATEVAVCESLKSRQNISLKGLQ